MQRQIFLIYRICVVSMSRCGHSREYLLDRGELFVSQPLDHELCGTLFNEAAKQAQLGNIALR